MANYRNIINPDMETQVHNLEERIEKLDEQIEFFGKHEKVMSVAEKGKLKEMRRLRKLAKKRLTDLKRSRK